MKAKYNKVTKWIGVFVVILLSIHLSIEPLYTPTAISSSANQALFPKLIAHKAMLLKNSKANTLEAIKEAMASYVDGIEIDVRLSKDNVPFLYHGDTLEEATSGRGAPEDYTCEQLEELFYVPHETCKIVTLEEIFKLVGSQKYIFLDIKTSKILDKLFAQKIAELIHKYHLKETVVVESFNPLFLTAMRLTARDILLMYDFTINAKATGEEVQAQFDKIPWLLRQPFFQKQVRRIVRPDILGPRWNLDPLLLKSLIDHGYPVISWTVDDPKTAHALFKLGVKGLQTNNPIDLMQYLPQTPQNVYDAGGSKSRVDKVVFVKGAQDVVDAIDEARKVGKKISTAGRRHSMGGQTLLAGSLHLNMMRIDHVDYSPEDFTVTVGAGATWKKIQSVLDEHGRSIKVMQSDNIFTVGGSISANVHGWQVGAPPIDSTVLSMKVVTADGKIRNISAATDTELFKAIMGGYGQFGVIIEVQLLTVPNSTLKFHAQFMDPKEFESKFQEHVTNNPNAELAYGRLSVDRDHLFEEAGLFWFEKEDGPSSKLTPESLVAFKRAIFRASQYAELGKALRWSAEKMYSKQLTSSGPISRNNAMNADIHILWPLYGKSKDILHEYFIPKGRVSEFLARFRDLIQASTVNVLNVTIREVQKDAISLLPYAKQDVFAFVILFSQRQGVEDEKLMQAFTQKLIAETLKLGGTFYLPYRLHYTHDQLLAAYPNLGEWLKIKAKWDPEKLFDSQFFEYISAAK